MGRYGAIELAPPVFGHDQTRPGDAVSPLDADAGDPLHARCTVNLDALFRASLQEKASMTNNGEVPHEDEPLLVDQAISSTPQGRCSVSPPLLSPPPPSSSEISPACSPVSRSSRTARPSLVPIQPAVPTPAPSVPAHRVPRPDGLTKAEFHRLKKVLRKRESRRELREKKQLAAGTHLKAACMKHRSGGTTFATHFSLRPNNVHVASTGVIGRALEVYHEVNRGTSLKASRRFGFGYVSWTGKSTCYIVDDSGLSFATLVGEPHDAEWPAIIDRVRAKFARAQEQLAMVEEEPDHRRGSYWSANTGYSMGSGQKRPGNLINSARRQRIIDGLLVDTDVMRVANFSSGALKNHVPGVYALYKENMEAMLNSDAELRPNFPNNVFAAATFNFGPRVITRVHLDHLNYAFGMCAVTALGSFNYRKGGHIILWDAKLIIEFPPGSTILIPSAILRHSNLNIARHETRYSFTQYTAGGLFRWVRAGFQTLKSLHAKGGNLSAEYEEWKEGWRLFPTISELLGHKDSCKQ